MRSEMYRVDFKAVICGPILVILLISAFKGRANHYSNTDASVKTEVQAARSNMTSYNWGPDFLVRGSFRLLFRTLPLNKQFGIGNYLAGELLERLKLWGCARNDGWMNDRYARANGCGSPPDFVRWVEGSLKKYWKIADPELRLIRLSWLLNEIKDQGALFYGAMGVLNYYLGQTFSILNRLGESFDAYERSLLYRDYLSPKWSSQIIENQGHLASYTGDFQQAIELYHQSKAIRYYDIGPNSMHVARSYGLLGAMYRLIGLSDSCVKYLKAAETIRRSGPDYQHFKLAELLFEIGESFLQQGQLDSALACFEEGMPLYNRQGEKRNITLAHFLRVWGQALVRKGDSARGWEKVNAAVQLAAGYKNEYNRDEGKIRVQAGELAFTIQDYDRAFFEADKALQELMPIGRSRQSIDSTLLLMTAPDPWIMNALFLKARCLQFRPKQSFRDSLSELKQALELYSLAFWEAEGIQIAMTSDHARYQMTQVLYPVVEDAINCGAALFQLDSDAEIMGSVSQFIQLGKRLGWTSAIQGFMPSLDNKALREIDSLFKWQLVQEGLCRTLEAQLREKEPEENDRLIIQDSLIRIRKSLRQVQIRSKQPVMNEAPGLIVSHSKLQSQLPEGTLWLDYFWGAKKLYVLGVLRDQVRLSFIDRDSLFEKAFNGFIEELRAQPGTYEEGRNMLLSGYALYRHLGLSAILGDSFEQTHLIDRLLICPDGKLWNLSFGALPKKEPGKDERNFKSVRYLIQDYVISYQFSAGIYCHQSSEKKESNSVNPTTRNWIGKSSVKKGLQTGVFGLQFLQDSIMFPLGRDFKSFLLKSAVKNRGVAFLDTLASSHQFKVNAGQFPLLFIGTHAYADTLNPLKSYLVLDDGPFYAYQVYRLSLQAQCTILFGCFTGGGQILNGVGVLGISRAFFTAGSRALVVSLWEIPNFPGTTLYGRFLKLLGRRYPLDVALQKTVVDYLNQSHLAGLDRLPHHWGSLIHIGEVSGVVQ